MSASFSGTAARSAAFAIVLLAAPFVGSAAAQDRPSPVGEFAVGALSFADDGVVREGFVGGAARFYVSPRISVGPEVAFIKGANHDHLMVTGNVTVDVLGPVNGQARAVTPFAVVGGGLFRTSESFPNETFSHNEGAFTAGGGLRALVGKYVIVGAEARIGWELHVRLNAMVGVRLGQ